MLLRLLSSSVRQTRSNGYHSCLRCCSAAADVAVKQQSPQQSASVADDATASLQLQTGPGAVLQQRYAAMLSAGVLRPDAHQQQLVAQLALLLGQLQEYSSQVKAYRASRDLYEVKYQQRLSELELLDRLRENEQEQHSNTAPTPSSSSGGGWLSKMLGSITGSSSAPKTELTPQQKARRAAAARQARARQDVGPPPAPPSAPQGLYVYGSVGSGKSLLMDLFYDTARQELQLDHSRRMHFNAAMLELHSRLHRLDVQREQRQHKRRQQEEARANAIAAAATASTAATSAPPAAAASGQVASAGDGGAHAISAEQRAAKEAAAAAEEAAEAEAEAVQQIEEALEEADEAGSDRQVSAWFDDAQWQQKEAKAAVLAIRKHLRATRAGRVPIARLAAANAFVMSAAARSFIRAPGADPSSGWEVGPSRGGERMAALLCFDEMQSGDVFSAAALKALLEALTAEGCVVVTTSNRHPADLPRHGLHEAMFGHFLNTLMSSCQLFKLSATEDYRRLSLTTAATQLLQQPLQPARGLGSSISAEVTAAAISSSSSGSSSSSSNGSSSGEVDRMYFWPLGPTADAAMHQLWAQHLGSSPGSSGSNAGGWAGSSGSSAGGWSGSSGGGWSGSSGSSGSTNPLELLATDGPYAKASPTQPSSSSSSSSAGSIDSSSSSSGFVPVMFGRSLQVPQAAGGAAWFDFEELCGKPLGSADYLALAQHYHTLFLSGVPAMSFANRDKARRFISLVDELYNARVALVCSAALPPDQLFCDGQGETPLLDLEGLQFEGAVEGSKLRTDLMSDGGVAPVISTAREAAEAAALLGGAEEKFAFARAVSRLYEMQSPLFLAARPRQ